MELPDLFPDDARHVVRRTFDLMEIAEQEISRALRRRSSASPEVRDRLKRAFLALSPPPQLLRKADSVYRHHAAELLQRAARGQDLRPGTDAEVLCAMLDCSLAAPPTALVGLACARLGTVVLGKDFGDLSTEPWSGAVAELVADMRRRVAVSDRKLKDDA